MNETLEQEGLLAEMAEDAKLTHVVASAIVDGAYYVLGFRDSMWAFVYGADDGEWGCVFDTFAEVGEPYQPWFLGAVTLFVRTRDTTRDTPVLFDFDEAHTGGTYKGVSRQAYVPASLIFALGHARAFEVWLRVAPRHIIRWNETAMPKDVSGVIPRS